jgi:glycosyltransferase involved in cell wall biosynthesis
VSNIRLSICIATRNRAAFIGETLDSLIAQATEEVEIIIVDGASTDNTEVVVRQYQERFPRLRYQRLSANGGFDQDYSRTVELAQGEYCWLMTDDDTFKPNAIETVLHHSQQGYGLIIVNAENRTVDQSVVIHEQRLRIDGDRIYQPTESEALFVDVGYHLTYIGGVVIKRALWNARAKEPYYGTWFVHFGVIFQQPLPEPTLVLAEPLINGRIGNISWSARSFEIWMFRWPELVWSMPFPHHAKAQITPLAPWRNLKAVLIHRGDGSYSLTEYRRWIAPRPAPAWHKLVAQVIAILPRCAVWLFVYFYLSLLRRQRRTELYHWLHVPMAQQCFGWLMRRTWVAMPSGDQRSRIGS